MPGTIYGSYDFDSAAIVDSLRDSMEGWGTDEDAIIKTLVSYNNYQRQEIASAFKTAYGKDLIDDLKSELRGDFEEVTVALMTPPRLYDAQQLHQALSGAGTDETTLIEIMCTRNNDEIAEIKELYKTQFDSDLEEDLQSDTRGYFERLMVSLCTGGRDESTDIDYDRATDDAKAFYEAGEAIWGTNEAEMNAILCLRSLPQLRQTIVFYEQFTGKSMEESIKDECGGNLEAGYLAIVESAKDLPGFFARRLKESFEGFGTKDNDLIRIMVSRSEIDLKDISEAFEAKYQTPLGEAISSECSGDYKSMLLAILYAS